MTYYLIGLNEDGRLKLYDRMAKRPDEEELARIAKRFNYTQMLLIDDGSMYRYEYDIEPRLREVSV